MVTARETQLRDALQQLGLPHIDEALDELRDTTGLNTDKIDTLRNGTWLSIGAADRWLRVGRADASHLAQREQNAARHLGTRSVGVLAVQLTAQLTIIEQERLTASRPTTWADVAESIRRIDDLDWPDLEDNEARVISDLCGWTLNASRRGLITRQEAEQLLRKAFDAAAGIDGRVGIVHGDAHRGNILVAPAPKLIDLETVGRGRLVYDRIVVDVERRRYNAGDGSVAAFRRVISQTRPDLASKKGRENAIRLYETWACGWACGWAARTGLNENEARLRIDSLLHGKRERWTRL